MGERKNLSGDVVVSTGDGVHDFVVALQSAVYCGLDDTAVSNTTKH